MGIFKSLRKGIGARLIAKDSFNKYMAVKMTYPYMSEAEIADVIFEDCYIMNNMTIPLDAKEILRASNYTSTGFECNSLIAVCLIALDVEGKTPVYDEDFDPAVKIIIKELEKLGFVKEGSGSLSKDAHAFKEKWRLSVLPNSKLQK